MVSNEHAQLEKLSSTAPMLPSNGKNHTSHVIIAPSSNGVGKLLLREDTILGSMQGCAGCGRAQFQCGGMKKQWSALCWGKPSEKKYTCMMLTLMTTFLVSLIGTVFFCFTNFLNNAIISNMVLSNNSLAFQMWQHPTIEPLMKVHIFNYTNVDRVRNGQDHKLRVDDLGPFVYSQAVERVNTHFNGDGTLTFQERAAFTFLPELSNGTQFDRVVVPNLPLIGAIHKSVPFGSFVQFSLNTGLSLLPNHGAFIELAAHRFLWGYDDEIVKIAAPILKLKGEMPFDRFGLLVTKNGTLPDRITINTGERDINRINYIERINGHTSLNHWGTPSCNSMEATDGSIFPASMLDRNTTLYVYKDNLCRRMPFVYQKDVEVLDGILALRYAPPLNVFDDPAHNPDNQCFCHIDSGRCPPRGLVNVSACAFGSPAMASFPHFYLGDERLVNSMEGLHPDPRLHSSYIDLHPKLGIPLNIRSGIQLNVQVPKTDFFFSELHYLEQGSILPIAWIETTMGTIPQGIRTLVYHGTYSTAAAQLALSWGCGLLLLISGSSLILLFRRRRPRPCATIRKLPDAKSPSPAFDSL